MTVQGLGTQRWLLQGQVRLNYDMHLRNLLTLVRKILLKCHDSLCLPPASYQEFGKYLEKELHVTPDAEQFSRESHWWIPESPPGAAVGAPVRAGGRARPPARRSEGCARYAGVGLQPPPSLRRQVLPSHRNFSSLDGGNGAVRRPSVRVSRPRLAGVALRRRGWWTPLPSRACAERLAPPPVEERS